MTARSFSPSVLRVCCALLVLAQAAWAEVDYAKEIKPLLKARCYACHGALKQKAGLRLDSVALMRKGGDSGDIIHPAPALLLERVTTTDKHDRMPPEGAPLNAEEIGKLKAWIAAGAPAPTNDQPEADPAQHWAYQPPKASGSPPSTLDTLIEARLRQRGLQPQPEAAPEVWLRRVYLDLTGLPPTAEEVKAFAPEAHGAHGSNAPYEKLIDRLLASPAYGERWGRHFMDIWRYSDWSGLDGKAPPQPETSSGTGATGSWNRSTPTRATTG